MVAVDMVFALRGAMLSCVAPSWQVIVDNRLQRPGPGGRA